MVQCPGQDKRFWKPKDIFDVKCPDCGIPVEFWKDDPKLKCPKCGALITNPKLDLSCAQWCKYAKECLGISPGVDANILCDNLIDEMKLAHSGHQQRIDHAIEVFKYAEKIQAAEGGDPLVVKAVSLLRDIDSQKARGPSDPAKDILIKYGVDPEHIQQICVLLTADRRAKDTESIEWAIICDAENLTKFSEELPTADHENINETIDSLLKTNRARQLAKDLIKNPKR